jgi:hypothetical protein
MAIDYQGLTQQIRRLGQDVIAFQRLLSTKKEQVRSLFQQYDEQGALLYDKVKSAARANPSLRCALPGRESLRTHRTSGHDHHDVLVLAADGSQITPDRHAQINYYLVNVGAIQMRLGSGEAPLTHTHSRIIFGADLYTQQGAVSSDAVFLQRDLQERQVLADLVQEIRTLKTQPKAPASIVTLTDGTLELWGTKERSAEAGTVFRTTLTAYKSCLARLHSLGAITAAYVDKPRADLVVRLLEIAALDENRLDQAGKPGAFQGINDEMLFEEILAAGERSAVFGMQSQSVQDYPNELALHFFYLNAGSDRHPWIARVEIPAWVAESDDMLATLHAVLIQQCRTLGNTPYPYLLHRAHETAVVTQQDKEQVTQMIVQEYMRRGVPTGQVSHKQHLKNQPGRTRL